MSGPTVVDWMQGIGAVATPLVAAVLVYMLTRRQARSHELLSARLEYYKLLVPDLNALMCYMTFIGEWKRWSPSEIVALKRRLDTNLHCAAPLFSPDVSKAYSMFMRRCFRTFNEWGSDAALKTSAFRRREAHPGWEGRWDRLFAYSDEHEISGLELAEIRDAYDALIAAIVRDIDITRTRARYTTSSVVINAHAPSGSLRNGADQVGG